MKSLIVALTAIVCATLIATEFAYVAHERAQTESTAEAFKLLLFSQALKNAAPAAPAKPVKPDYPGGAQLETL